jgi:hypothetical protein
MIYVVLSYSFIKRSRRTDPILTLVLDLVGEDGVMHLASTPTLNMLIYSLLPL